MSSTASFVVFVALLLTALPSVSAISFDLPPGKVECFYEDVHQGTSINGAFAVTHGGSHMDIDVTIYNPDDKQVYNAKREGEDKFMLKAEKDGTYRFCFGNTVSTRTFFCFLMHSSAERQFLTHNLHMYVPLPHVSRASKDEHGLPQNRQSRYFHRGLR